MNAFLEKRTLSKRTRDFIQQFFCILEQNEIAYCVVGQTQCLSFAMEEDIDVVVPNECLPRLPDVFLNIHKESEFRLVQYIQHEVTACFYIFYSESENEFLQIDISGDYLRRGIFFLSAREILEGRRVRDLARQGGPRFSAASPKMEFVYYLLKKIDKGVLNDRHGAHLSAVWHQERAGVNGMIESFVGRTHAATIARAATTNSWNEVRAILPEVQNSLYRHLPRSSVSLSAGEFRRKVSRVLLPAGLQVVVLGPDGSGKSSVVETTLKGLAPAFRRARGIHLRPGPELWKQAEEAPTDPHGNASWNTVLSIGKIVYLLGHYVIGWWLVVRPMLVRSTIVVFDRYYHDLLVDPKRYRYGGPLGLARLIGKFVPKPDLWILLDAPPEVLQGRKREVSIKESGKQRETYLKFIEDMNNAVVVDASQPLDDVVADVSSACLNILFERTRIRLGR